MQRKINLSEPVCVERFLHILPDGCIIGKTVKKAETQESRMSIEFELKYTATPQSLSALQQHFTGEAQVLSMETVYYETPGEDFSARKATLRCRKENGQPVCTLKTAAAGLARHEYTLCCDSITEAAQKLCKLATYRKENFLKIRCTILIIYT